VGSTIHKLARNHINAGCIFNGAGSPIVAIVSTALNPRTGESHLSERS